MRSADAIARWPCCSDELVQRVLARAEHAAGVDDGDVRALPFGVGGDDVAGGAGNRRDDGPARAGQPIEERGLADIGASDEHDGAFSGGVLAGHDLTGRGVAETYAAG